MSRTLNRVGSREVHERMSLAVTGREVSMLSESVTSRGGVSFWGVSGRGSRLNTSALACSVPGLY